jgi:hypothetical protein
MKATIIPVKIHCKHCGGRLFDELDDVTWKTERRCIECGRPHDANGNLIIPEFTGKVWLEKVKN